jgi:hypothetical protein
VTTVQSKRLLLALTCIEQTIRTLRDLKDELPGNSNLALAHGQACLASNTMRSAIRIAHEEQNKEKNASSV